MIDAHMRQLKAQRALNSASAQLGYRREVALLQHGARRHKAAAAGNHLAAAQITVQILERDPARRQKRIPANGPAKASMADTPPESSAGKNLTTRSPLV